MQFEFVVQRIPRLAAATAALGRLIDLVRLGSSESSEVFRWRNVPEPPDQHEPYTLYVVGTNRHLWSAEFVCPCGCKAIIQLSLHPDGRPRWRVIRHLSGRASLVPSVWRTKGCKSHFILSSGRVSFV